MTANWSREEADKERSIREGWKHSILMKDEQMGGTLYVIYERRGKMLAQWRSIYWVVGEGNCGGLHPEIGMKTKLCLRKRKRG